MYNLHGKVPQRLLDINDSDEIFIDITILVFMVH